VNKLRSNTDDCIELATILTESFQDRIEIFGTTTELALRGKYQSVPFNDSFFSSKDDYIQDRVLFSYEYNKDGYLRLKIHDGLYEHSLGHKLAVLSDFYEVLYERFGNPCLFYMINDDSDECLYLEWCFTNIKNISGLVRFSLYNPNVKKIIIIEKKEQKISKLLGLPRELMDLIDVNIDDYLRYKNSKYQSHFKCQNKVFNLN